MADALRKRGVSDPAASLTAEAGIAVFKDRVRPLAGRSRPARPAKLIRESFGELKAVTAGQ